MNSFSIGKIVFLFITCILLVEFIMRIFPPTGLIYKLRDKQVHCIEEWEIPEILLCPNSDTILPTLPDLLLEFE